jgi:predicted enzyme related to lactoylglutathione lyase
MEPSDATPAPARIAGLTFVAAYVDDLERAISFYRDVLGLEKAFDMGPSACFMKINDEVGLYIEGGNEPLKVTPKTVRASFGLTAESVRAMFERVKASEATIVHANGPQDMGGGQAWFQCYDPAGNLIEIVGDL